MKTALLCSLGMVFTAVLVVLVILNLAASTALREQHQQQLTQLHWNYGGDDEAVNQPPMR